MNDLEKLERQKRIIRFVLDATTVGVVLCIVTAILTIVARLP